MFAVPRPRVADRPEAVPVIVPLESASDPLSAFSTERAAEPVRDGSGALESRPRGEHGAPLVGAAAVLRQGAGTPRSASMRLLPIAFAAGVLAGVAGAAVLAARTPIDGYSGAAGPPPEAPPLVSTVAMAPCVAPAAAAVIAQPPQAGGPALAERRAPMATVAAVAPVTRDAAAVPGTGSLAISSPFVVQAFVDGTLAGDSASPRLNVPAGTHELRLVSDELEFAQVTSIDVTPRSLTRLVVERPMGTLHINAQPWAQVWVDGRRMGDTPLGNLRLLIGAHDVLLRHPSLGEEKRTVVVGARTPVHLGVEFKR